MVRYIGMDVHREFAQLAVLEDGLVRDEGKFGVTPEALRRWAEGLRSDDEVALEATGPPVAGQPRSAHSRDQRPGAAQTVRAVTTADTTLAGLYGAGPVVAAPSLGRSSTFPATTCGTRSPRVCCLRSS